MKTILIRVQLRDELDRMELFDTALNLVEHIHETFNDDNSLESVEVVEPRP